MFEGLKKRRVLITGGSGDIGSSIVRLFASYGAIIGIHYNQSKKEADSLRGEIEARGGEVECFKKDLLENAASSGLIQDFLDRFGSIDILINNAGAVIGNSHFLELEEREWDDTFTLNAKAPFFLAKKVFAIMKDRGGGKIINVSSISAKYGGSLKTMHYGAAKAALEAMTVGLARAGAPYNILVNSIRAGFIDTRFHQKIQRDQLEERIKLIPLKRAGRPMDIAQMALFLASEAGDYITGEIFTVSGGD